MNQTTTQVESVRGFLKALNAWEQRSKKQDIRHPLGKVQLQERIKNLSPASWGSGRSPHAKSSAPRFTLMMSSQRINTVQF